MDARIKAHIEAHEGETLSDEAILEILLDETPVYREVISEHRWWSVEYRVVKIGDMLIGFDWGITTGDDTAEEKGWQFDPASIKEAVAKEITTTIYTPKED